MSLAETEKHFVFAHSGLQYALPVMQVLEIVETPTLLPAHGAMPACLGNLSHRQYLLPVLDPTAVGSGRGIAPPSKNVVIVRFEATVFGLAMDRFVAVVALDALDAQPTSGSDPNTAANPLVETVRAFRGNALISLSITAIVALVRRSFGSQKLMVDGERTAEGRLDAVASEGRIFLCARIERALFCIPVEHVIEVIEGYDVTPLFRVPPIIRGLINLRGQVLACLDISDDLGFPLRQLEEHNQFVVLKHEDAELALCVDKVTGIRRLQAERIQKSDLVLSGEMTRYADGVFEGNDGSLFVLAVDAIFEAPQLELHRRSEA